MENDYFFILCVYDVSCVCDVSSVDKIFDCQLEGPGFDSRLSHGVEY